jgi:hypothetical protein
LIVKPGGAAFTVCTLFSFFRAPFTLPDCPSTILRDLALSLGIVIPGCGAAIQALCAVGRFGCGLLAFPRPPRMFLREFTLAYGLIPT